VEKLIPLIQETVAFALSGSPVTSQFHIHDDLWFCDFDRNHIGQVIDNLTINARQAMAKGGIIDVSVRNVIFAEGKQNLLHAGNYVKISLKDQGIGIPKELLPNIFDLYYSTKPRGHGLGLAICSSIISRHGGCLDVESGPQARKFLFFSQAVIRTTR